MYEITNDQLQELLVTKTVNISYTQGSTNPNPKLFSEMLY